jgi:hypothetical protein
MVFENMAPVIGMIQAEDSNFSYLENGISETKFSMTSKKQMAFFLIIQCHHFFSGIIKMHSTAPSINSILFFFFLVLGIEPSVS